MAVDAPAKIAIIGAGPIGLEAALYARYLGYEVDVFESEVVCGRVLAQRDRPLLTPFAKNSSRLALAALAAHDANYSPPAADAYLTCGEWYDRYLAPLAATDLIADSLRLGVAVRSIGKVEITKCDTPSGEYDRGSWDFRLLTQNQHDQQEAISIADVVLDCSGRAPGRAGHGGIPAIGEATTRRELLAYEIASAASYRGKSVLVVGDSECAAQSVVALVHNGAAKVTWATRHERAQGAGPLDVRQYDPLLSRRELLLAANELVTSAKITWWPGTWLEQMHECNGRAVVQLSGEHEETAEFDAVVAQTGYRIETALTSELQLDLCPVSAAPRPFANWLTTRTSPDSTDYPAPDAAALITSEPNYYVLGAKTFGCLPGYLHQHGLRQIRDVFSILGDRANLDLYWDK